MDRFIEVCTLGDFLGGLDLKSNMDRFIATVAQPPYCAIYI